MEISYRGHEEHSSTKAVHEHGCSDRPNQVPNLKACGDEGLIINRSDANRVEDDGQVVRNHTVARPLREGAQTNADE